MSYRGEMTEEEEVMKRAAEYTKMATLHATTRKQAIADLIRLNSLLQFIPLTAQRQTHQLSIDLRLRCDPEQDGEDATQEVWDHPFVNYSRLYSFVIANCANNKTHADRVKIHQLVPSPETIHSGDTVQAGSDYRGCGNHFALWLKKGITVGCEPNDESSKLISLVELDLAQTLNTTTIGSSGAVSDAVPKPSRSRPPFPHYRMPYSLMCELREHDAYQGDDWTQYEAQLLAIAAKMPKEIQSAVIDPVNPINTTDLFWYAPTEAVPPILPRARMSSELDSTGNSFAAIQLDPLSPLRPLSETHDLYLFRHIDENGYTDSSIASIAGKRYLWTDDCSCRMIDPLLAHPKSETGIAIERVRNSTSKHARKLRSNPSFPHGFVLHDDPGSYEPNELIDRLAWQSFDEMDQHYALYGQLHLVREIMAEHLKWLEERLEKEQPSVYQRLNITKSDPDSASASTSSSHKRAVSPTAEIASSSDQPSKKSRIGTDASDRTAIDSSSSFSAGASSSSTTSASSSSSSIASTVPASSSDIRSHLIDDSEISMPNVLADLIMDYVYDPILGVMAHLDLLDVLQTTGKWEKVEGEEEEEGEEKEEDGDGGGDGDSDDGTKMEESKNDGENEDEENDEEEVDEENDCEDDE